MWRAMNNDLSNTQAFNIVQLLQLGCLLYVRCTHLLLSNQVMFSPRLASVSVYITVFSNYFTHIKCSPIEDIVLFKLVQESPVRSAEKDYQ